MDERRKVDAFIIPAGFAGDDLAAFRHDRVKRELLPFSGGSTINWSDVGNYRFGYPVRTGDHFRDHQTLLWPKGHPLHPQSRHEWFAAEKGPDGQWRPVALADGHADMPGVVKFGYLKDDPYKDDPDVVGTMATAARGLEDRARAALAAKLADDEGRKDLRDRLGVSDEELDRMFGHLKGDE